MNIPVVRSPIRRAVSGPRVRRQPDILYRQRRLMSMQRVAWALLAVVMISPPVAGQDVLEGAADILQSILLPSVSEILRDRGVPTEEIEAAIDGARRNGVSPGETAGIFQETVTFVDENGPIENFGGFVQAQLERGLRGRDLANAIRAEHAARGIGRGSRLPSAPGQQGRDRAPEGRGPGATGQPATPGDRPDRRGPGGAGGLR